MVAMGDGWVMWCEGGNSGTLDAGSQGFGYGVKTGRGIRAKLKDNTKDIKQGFLIQLYSHSY